jgi:peptide/nickel transport system substrate-binding protein
MFRWVGHHRLRIALAAIVVTALLAPSAMADSPSPAASAKGTSPPGASVLHIGYTSAFGETAINPFLVYLSIDYELLSLNYDLLVEYGSKDFAPAAGLASSWEKSPDGLTWTFHMRSGATWQDGQPVTADDVAFTYNYLIQSHNPAYVGPWAPKGNNLTDKTAADNPLTYFDAYLDLDTGFSNTRIVSVTAPDPKTVVITAKAPVSTLQLLYIPIVPKHVWNSITFADAATKALFDVTKSIGSGPYQVVEFRPKELIRLKANPAYWGGAPKFDEIIYQFYGSTDAAIQALKSGEIQFLEDVPNSQFAALGNDSQIATLAAKSPSFIELGFQSWNPSPAQFKAVGCSDKTTCKIGPTTGANGNPWLTRADVRRALMGLVDKVELVDKALNGLGDPGASLVSAYLNPFGYKPAADDPLIYPTYQPGDTAGKAAVRTQRTAAARAALEALGFKDTDGNGILNAPSDPASKAFDPRGAGKDFKLRLYVRDTKPEDQLAGDLIKQWFEAAGVAVDKQVVKEDFLITATIPADSNADSDLYIWGWGPDPDPNFILGAMTTDSIGNWQDANWSDPAYDTLVAQQRITADVAARKAVIGQALKLFYQQGPYAVLWYANDLQAYRKDLVTGFKQLPEGTGPWWTPYAFGSYGSMLTAELASEASPTAAPSGGSSTPSSAGSNLGLILGFAALVVVLGAGGVWVARRRSAGDEDD